MLMYAKANILYNNMHIGFKIHIEKSLNVLPCDVINSFLRQCQKEERKKFYLKF